MDPLLARFYQIYNLPYVADHNLRNRIVETLREYRNNGFNGALINTPPDERDIIQDLNQHYHPYAYDGDEGNIYVPPYINR